MVDVMEILQEFTHPDLWMDDSIWKVALEVNSLDVVTALIRCSAMGVPETIYHVSMETCMERYGVSSDVKNQIHACKIDLEDID